MGQVQINTSVSIEEKMIEAKESREMSSGALDHIELQKGRC